MKRVQLVKFVKLVQLGVGVLGVLLVVGIWARAGAQGTHPAEGVGFGTMDVVVDSGKAELGAYQVEVMAPVGVEIVGLEGGEGVFKDAPFYDPKALMGRRIVAAGFSTEEGLPKGATRVARLHLQVTAGGEGMPKLDNKLVVATDGQGRTIKANVTLRAFEGDRR